MSAGRRQHRRIAPLAHELEPDVELYEADEPQGRHRSGDAEPQDDAEAASPVVAVGPNGSAEPLQSPVSDEKGSGGVRTAGDDLRKLTEPYSGRPPGGWPMVPMHDEPKPRSWRSADDPEMAALLAWQPPDVTEPDPLAAHVVLSPVTPGAQRPAALLAYFAALADDTDRTSYAAADAGADDLSVTLVRIASWLRSVASLSEPS